MIGGWVGGWVGKTYPKDQEAGHDREDAGVVRVGGEDEAFVFVVVEGTDGDLFCMGKVGGWVGRMRRRRTMGRWRKPCMGRWVGGWVVEEVR